MSDQDDPSPPPQQERQDQEVYPFVEVSAAGTPAATVRAGWADVETDEPVRLAFDYEGPVSSGAPDQVAEAALAWYRDALAATQQ